MALSIRILPVAALAVLALASPAQAIPELDQFLYVEVDVAWIGEDDEFYDDADDTSEPPSTSAISASVTIDDGEVASASAEAAYGVLKAKASAVAERSDAEHEARALAAFRDTITIGHNGTCDPGPCSGFVMFQFALSGSLGQTGEGFSSVQIDLLVDDIGEGYGEEIYSGASVVSELVPSAVVEFDFGVPFDVQFELRTEVQGVGSSDFFATAELTQIFVAGGEGTLTATSASGTDYSGFLLPEPTALVLIGFGLAGLGVVRRT